MAEVTEALRTLVAELRPEVLDGAGAVARLESYAVLKNLATAGEALCASRVASTGVWKPSGERSAAHFVSRLTGSSLSEADRTLEAATHLSDLPATEAAWRNGELSGPQVREIVPAASLCPSKESELLDTARTEPMGGLRKSCRTVIATSAGEDEMAKTLAIHRSRYLHHWRDPDGAFRMDVRATVDEGASLLAAMEPFERAVFEAARTAGRTERYDAYAVDALFELARAARRARDGGSPRASGSDGSAGGNRSAGATSAAGAKDSDTGSAQGGAGTNGSGSAGAAPPALVLPGPRATINVVADYFALVRGHALVGETCEVPGLGPVPVALVREWMTDCILNVVVTKGVDIATVAHGGRSIPAALRTAVFVRDRECAVRGCHNTACEYDHKDPWSVSRITSVENLQLLCKFHHRQKTYEGYRFVGPPGNQRWEPPERSASDRSPPHRPSPDGSPLDGPSPDGSATDGSATDGPEGSNGSDSDRPKGDQLMFHLREAIWNTRKL